MSPSPRFREVQRFRQPWLWAFLLLNGGAALLLVVAAVHDEHGGFTPAAVRSIAVSVALVAAPLVAVHRCRLVTEVREDGLYLRFFPFQLSFRRVALADIERAETTEFSPLREFGGWGIRWGLSVSRDGVGFDGPKAYLVGGSAGVRVERTGDRPLVVGSRRPAALRRAIDAARAR